MWAYYGVLGLSRHGVQSRGIVREPFTKYFARYYGPYV